MLVILITVDYNSFNLDFPEVHGMFSFFLIYCFFGISLIIQHLLSNYENSFP